jgi:UPF0716 protein FxsA
MVGVLLLLFLIVPIVELYVIIEVGGWLGVWPTLGLLVLVSVVGAWLVKHEGLGVWTRAQRQLQRSELPANELLDGLLILFAGALMLTPGFVTDIVGLVLLVPPTRALVRSLLSRRFRRRFDLATGGFAGPGGSFGFARVYDVRDVGDVTPPQWRGSRGADQIGPPPDQHAPHRDERAGS